MTCTRIGDFILSKTIGEGSFGKVKYAEHVGTGEPFAVKVLDKENIRRRCLTVQVRREISVMKQLRHKNVVRLHQVLSTIDKVFLVMEHVTGGELFEEILRWKRMPEDVARYYFLQLLDGLEHCHLRGVFHRDLKPENLLLDRSGLLKITDFGLSTLKGKDKASDLLHTQCGTPNYVAPEIIERASTGYSGEKSDIWSCGIILYVLLVGYLPFDDDDHNELFRKILTCEIDYPEALSTSAVDLISRLLDTDPERRYNIQQTRAHEWCMKLPSGGEVLYRGSSFATHGLMPSEHSEQTWDPTLMEGESQLNELSQQLESTLNVQESSGRLSPDLAENFEMDSLMSSTAQTQSQNVDENLIGPSFTLSQEAYLTPTREPVGLMPCSKGEQGVGGELLTSASLEEVSKKNYAPEMPNVPESSLEVTPGNKHGPSIGTRHGGGTPVENQPKQSGLTTPLLMEGTDDSGVPFAGDGQKSRERALDEISRIVDQSSSQQQGGEQIAISLLSTPEHLVCCNGSEDVTSSLVQVNEERVHNVDGWTPIFERRAEVEKGPSAHENQRSSEEGSCGKAPSPSWVTVNQHDIPLMEHEGEQVIKSKKRDEPSSLTKQSEKQDRTSGSSNGKRSKGKPISLEALVHGGTLRVHTGPDVVNSQDAQDEFGVSDGELNSCWDTEMGGEREPLRRGSDKRAMTVGSRVERFMRWRHRSREPSCIQEGVWMLPLSVDDVEWLSSRENMSAGNLRFTDCVRFKVIRGAKKAREAQIRKKLESDNGLMDLSKPWFYPTARGKTLSKPPIEPPLRDETDSGTLISRDCNFGVGSEQLFISRSYGGSPSLKRVHM
uniref:non-specific serine/threonine protein kinase n=1 Tax=Compsopogon caeruleus TaxID=31354 RepID=A0A7S1XD48_9RHOD|mmetsp:Transcript_14247/g.29137  ORF Transcript_14247/g.29137 Transcript_14247/m.29137 type:complete len:835 (+) Transcript_14247:252-2756(+)|eukprot:CAMPEP_0184684378 /NCGR_PEP_ID=MMETSP0312-20130426/15108_1 /TAXON_ID=31354 /ORGANISM="Compsopogon coeruleus, Strain SAG 36.94" /LENGTH=834 /DNA_ID=CAMNT_0027137505 /DNA_START=210 /DNA_END=2714 /DNA_ORIENTATION=+